MIKTSIFKVILNESLLKANGKLFNHNQYTSNSALEYRLMGKFLMEYCFESIKILHQWMWMDFLNRCKRNTNHQTSSKYCCTILVFVLMNILSYNILFSLKNYDL
jgi:hypothetical protein